MEKILKTAKERAQWVKHTAKIVAVAASSGAALVSIFTALISYGVIGASESHQSIGNMGAAWVGLRPSIDTATALGDTIHYAATVTDKNGSILVGARPTWTTGDSSIAVVLQDGSVVARGPGRTMVSVVVGKLVTHSTIFVHQRVASIEVGRASGDSLIVLPEGSQLQLRAQPVDARGFPVAGLETSWHIDDNSVASLDSSGLLTGKSAGRTSIAAKIEGVAGRASVSVVTPASAIALVAGTNQRALAGKTLPQSGVVRATNRRGTAASGQRVAFQGADGQGAVAPARVVAHGFTWPSERPLDLGEKNRLTAASRPGWQRGRARNPSRNVEGDGTGRGCGRRRRHRGRQSESGGWDRVAQSNDLQSCRCQ